MCIFAALNRELINNIISDPDIGAFETLPMMRLLSFLVPGF
jgi:hypothetical protein